jgi:hypothetical protein
MTLKSEILESACDDKECGSIANPKSSTSRRRSRGLLLRKGVWHIDKVIYGKRICESTQTGDLVEAEALLVMRAMSLDAPHRGLVSETKRRKLGVQAILLH